LFGDGIYKTTETGEVKNLSDLAPTLCVSRVRIFQVLSLLKPDDQASRNVPFFDFKPIARCHVPQFVKQATADDIRPLEIQMMGDSNIG
jgi:hypothetical protein